jgi:adenosylmethionine-8-amino-7-oxononanoate aminotransferase
MIRISGNNIIISPALVITADHVATIVAALDVGLTAAAKA